MNALELGSVHATICDPFCFNGFEQLIADGWELISTAWE